MAEVDNVWDCIVVGAGIVGSWTGYHLRSNDKSTLILEQFSMPHTRGSSGGQSRIIRMAYTKDWYAEMMPEAYRQWHQLEKETQTTLLRNTGMLLVQHNDVRGHIESSISAMDRYHYPYTLLSYDETSKKYPMLSFNDEYRSLYDDNAGLLLANKCLDAIQTAFKRKGGTIKDSVKVERIIPGSTIEVVTNQGKFYAKKLVLAAGPWTKDLTEQLGLNLPLKTMPGLSLFFRERDSHMSKHSADSKFPIVQNYLYYEPEKYRFVAMFPCLEYPNMVKMVTRGEPPDYYCHPDVRDNKGTQGMRTILENFVKKHCPGLDPEPCIAELCVYTLTPDLDFILDKHPKHDNIVIGAGFSGSGYKLAPISGLMLTALLYQRPLPYSIKPFMIARFQKHAAKL